MSGLVLLDREKLARRFEGEPTVFEDRRTTGEEAPYNFVLRCGNMIQIFTPDRFHEVPYEVQRLVDWGNPLEEIHLGVLEANDPFR